MYVNVEAHMKKFPEKDGGALIDMSEWEVEELTRQARPIPACR